MSDFVYLHGFASGAGSRKARFFREKLAGEGVALDVPDLNAGDFEGLTITRQLEAIAKLRPRVLIGSSLGGYVAALHAARSASVERLVLLAPAFGFAQRLLPQLFGEASLEEWRVRGSVPVFHYARGREEQIGYPLYVDARGYEAFPDFQQPAQIFHGVADRVVPVGISEEFAAGRANVRVFRLQSDH